MKHRILALLLAGLMLTACESSDQTTQTSATVTTTAAPIGTTEAPGTTSAPVTTVETPVTTTAPITTETPVTEAPETTAPSTMTEQPTTTDTPVTTDELVVTTTSDTPETTTETPITTEAPVTSTDTPVTTETPVTTTIAPITTTEAPETTETPVTEAPVVHTHSYSAWKTTKEATCTADGTKIRTCACGASESETIEATGHSYGSWKTTQAATCTADGTQTKTCAECGKTKTQAIDATGHSYGAWTVTKAATESAEGEETRTCKVCQKKETRKIAKLEHEHSYGAWTLCSDYINEEATCKTCGAKTTQIHYATEADERLIADRVIYYVNKYRAEEGTPTATKLDRLTLVAEMRSEQLTTNFAHDTDDQRAAQTYYKYGEHRVHEETRLDPETFEVIYTGNILDYYDIPGSREAIGYVFSRSTIDGVAENIATNCHNSEAHWAYVGSSDYPYIAVGVTKDGSYYYCAIEVIITDQYE